MLGAAMMQRNNFSLAGDIKAMLKGLLTVGVLVGTVSAAGAIELAELAPCKPAAVRYCDNGNTNPSMSNLLRCGAKLASVSNTVGESCRQVLRRYGQL